MTSERITEPRAASERRVVAHSILVAALGTASLLLAGSVAFGFAAEYDAALDDLLRSGDLRTELDRALQLIVDGETAQRGYVLTGNEEFLGPIEGIHRELPRTRARLRTLLPAAGLGSMRRPLEQAIAARMQFTERSITLARSRGLDAGRALIATGEGMRRTDAVRELVRETIRYQERRTQAARHRIAVAERQLVIAFAVLLVVSLLMASFAVTRVWRQVSALEAAAIALEEKERHAQRARELAEQSEQQFRALAEGASDLIRVQDRAGRLTYVNPACERLLGYRSEELFAVDPADVVHPDDREPLRAAFERTMRGERIEPILHRLIARDGSTRWFETRIEAIRGADGAVERAHAASRDVTARLAEDERRSRDTAELTEIALRDELTGLYNRRGLYVRADALFARAEAEGRAVLLAYCDVNGLKEINDRLGHEAGDGVIRDAARVLSAVSRDSDIVARIGGDELVVLGIVRNEVAARRFEERLRRQIRAHNDAHAKPYRVSISIGIELSTGDAPRSLQDLLKAADARMYAQKRTRPRGRTDSERPVVCDPSPIAPTEAQRLAAVRATGLLDAPPDAALEGLARVAALVAGTPTALVTLIEADRVFFAARTGIATTEGPRDTSFCTHAIAEEAPLIIEDAREDARFAANPHVVGEPYVTSYVGAPLTVGGGFRVGTLCVFDSEPRSFAPEVVAVLVERAAQASRVIEQRASDASAAAGSASSG